MSRGDGAENGAANPSRSFISQQPSPSVPAEDIAVKKDEAPTVPSYYSNGAEQAVSDGGGNGSDGKNTKYTGGNGGGNSGGQKGPSDDSEGSPNLAWYIKAFISMLGMVAIYIVLGKAILAENQEKPKQSLSTASTPSSSASAAASPDSLSSESLRSDIQTLKRLQREVFEQLYKINYQPKASSDQTLPSMKTTWSSLVRGASHLVLPWGNLTSSGAMELDEHEDQYTSTRESADISFRIRGDSWNKEKRFGLMSEISVPSQLFAGSFPVTTARMSKLVAAWKARSDLKLVAPLVNGKADDIAVTLNPQAGFGVSKAMKHGSPNHQLCQGSGIGATLSRDNLGISALHLVHHRGRSRNSEFEVVERSPTTTTSNTLLQVAGSLNEDIMLGAHFLHSRPFRSANTSSNIVNDQPVPSLNPGRTSSRHQAELDEGRGPGNILGAEERDSDSLGTSDHSQSAESSTLGQQDFFLGARSRIGLTGAWNIANRKTLSGWICCPMLQDPGPRELDLGATYGTLPIPGQTGWAITVGRSCEKLLFNRHRTLVAEAALRLYPEENMLLAPSLIACRETTGRQVLALALQSEWRM